MPGLLDTLKSFGLTEFYFSLLPDDKVCLAEYSNSLLCSNPRKKTCTPECEGCFMVNNAARFLWATAANAIPAGRLEFAEKLLTQAVQLAEDVEDLAWSHANLAQIYYDRHKLHPEAAKKGMAHCRELIRLGYMKSWAQNLMQEMAVFLV